MDHLIGYMFWSILILAILRMGTGVLVGWLMARLLPPSGTRGGHILSALAGAVIIPVLAEKVFGAPIALINMGMKSNSGMAVLLGYIIGFSAISAMVTVWIYRNFRLARRDS